MTQDQRSGRRRRRGKKLLLHRGLPCLPAAALRLCVDSELLFGSPPSERVSAAALLWDKPGHSKTPPPPQVPLPRPVQPGGDGLRVTVQELSTLHACNILQLCRWSFVL